jgi:hypothetical protein
LPDVVACHSDRREGAGFCFRVIGLEQRYHRSPAATPRHG